MRQFSISIVQVKFCVQCCVNVFSFSLLFLTGLPSSLEVSIEPDQELAKDKSIALQASSCYLLSGQEENGLFDGSLATSIISVSSLEKLVPRSDPWPTVIKARLSEPSQISALDKSPRSTGCVSWNFLFSPFSLLPSSFPLFPSTRNSISLFLARSSSILQSFRIQTRRTMIS